MAERVLMFGIGATKAGTSWLYRYLARHPDCAMPAVKELHYFDSLDGGTMRQEIARLHARRARIAAGPNPDPLRLAGIDRWIGIMSAGQEDTAAYLAYLAEGAGQARLVGDITPAYALLGEDRLRHLQALAPRVRFVYLLRDPLDRLWSNIRMVAARKTDDATVMARRATRILDRWLAGGEPDLTARSDYAGTLARLNAAVDPANLLVQFYETFFTPGALDRLCAFLGIGAHPADTTRRVHEGIRIPLPGDDRIAAARARLAPQYACVARRLGTLPERWQTNMAEV